MGGLARVGVLLSGRGSNFLALLEATRRRQLPAEIVAVVSNRPQARGLEHAREAGLRAVSIPHREAPTREAHEERVREVLTECRVEWVCLAGYMRLLSADFVSAYPQRILNIHPSLLPAFPGLEAQRQALEHGVKVSGCTVHLVDAGLDSGPVVVQRVVPVEEGDSVETLSTRILGMEHQAYPEALNRLLTEPWGVVGRRVWFGDPPTESMAAAGDGG